MPAVVKFEALVKKNWETVCHKRSFQNNVLPSVLESTICNNPSARLAPLPTTYPRSPLAGNAEGECAAEVISPAARALE